MEQIQSAFMIDLQQIAVALRLATRRSLIVIDEFGKGTTPSNGAGLACAVFEHLIDLPDAQRPKVVASTHYHELFESSFLGPHPRVWFGQMSVQISTTADDETTEVTYLYRLIEGRTLESHGTVCAAMNGIRKDVIDRANEIIQLAAQGEDLVAACMAISEEEAAELEEARKIAARFLDEFVDMEDDGTEDEEGVESVRARLERVLQPSSIDSQRHEMRTMRASL